MQQAHISLPLRDHFLVYLPIWVRSTSTVLPAFSVQRLVLPTCHLLLLFIYTNLLAVIPLKGRKVSLDSPSLYIWHICISLYIFYLLFHGEAETLPLTYSQLEIKFKQWEIYFQPGKGRVISCEIFEIQYVGNVGMLSYSMVELIRV